MQKVAYVAAGFRNQQNPGETIPGVDMMLDKAVAPSCGDVSERERAGAGSGRGGAGGSDPPQEVDELLRTRADIPADPFAGGGKRRTA